MHSDDDAADDDMNGIFREEKKGTKRKVHFYGGKK